MAMFEDQGMDVESVMPGCAGPVDQASSGPTSASLAPPMPVEPPARFRHLARWSWILAGLSIVPIIIMIFTAVTSDPFQPIVWPALLAEVLVSAASFMGLIAYCGNPAGTRGIARVETIMAIFISIGALVFVNLGAFGAIGILAMRQDRAPSVRPAKAAGQSVKRLEQPLLKRTP